MTARDESAFPTPDLALVLRAESGAERAFAVGEEPLVIGRGRECDVRIDRPEVSRRHVEVRREGSRVVARDLGSALGTLLNGSPLEGAQALAPGDRLSLGGTEIRVAHRPAGQAARAEAAADERATPRPQATELSSSVLTGDAARDARNVDLLLKTIAELYEAEDMEDLLRRVLDRAISLAGGERGAILLRAGVDGPLERAIARDREGRDLAPDERLTASVPARALAAGRAVVLTDTAKPEQRAQASASVISGALGSVLAVPLRAASRLVGVLYVDGKRPANAFGRSELVFFEALAGQAGIALERARAADARERRGKKLETENARLRERLGAIDPLGESPAMVRALELLRRVAPSDLTILIDGETGSGKEVLARLLHRLSPRKEGPFVVVDCGAIPENLVESELFGHERGAFTGAVEARPGRFRDAHGGTLLLDEIGELPLALQPKLLRVLQERTVVPVGGRGPIKVDVRVLAATHRDLSARVKEGAFREDLFYRLAVVRIPLPPLRERGDDVVLLARAFLARFATALSRPLQSFTRDALDAIQAHRWPGNVRELEHAIHRAAVLAEPPWVTRMDLGLGAASEDARDLPLEEALPFPSLRDARAGATERFERAYVAEALRRAGGNVTHAARTAGVSRQLLQRLMKRHGLRTEGDAAAPAAGESEGESDDGEQPTTSDQ